MAARGCGSITAEPAIGAIVARADGTPTISPPPRKTPMSLTILQIRKERQIKAAREAREDRRLYHKIRPQVDAMIAEARARRRSRNLRRGAYLALWALGAVGVLWAVLR